MKYLCENIQGRILGYTQSDEITLVLVDYKNMQSDSWFGNNVQKMASVSASMATMAFNKNFRDNAHMFGYNTKTEEGASYFDKLESKFDKAMFDSRVFQLPKEEVVNCLIWRQQDATRNSIQSIGQANFSQKQLHGKNVSKIQDMLMLEKNINWNDLDTKYKRGTCCVKTNYLINEGTENEAKRSKWIIDYDITIFTQDKDYVEKLVNV